MMESMQSSKSFDGYWSCCAMDSIPVVHITEPDTEPFSIDWLVAAFPTAISMMRYSRHPASTIVTMVPKYTKTRKKATRWNGIHSFILLGSLIRLAGLIRRLLCCSCLLGIFHLDLIDAGSEPRSLLGSPDSNTKAQV